MDEYADTMDEFNRSQQAAGDAQTKVLQTDEGLKSTHPDGSKLQPAVAADPNQQALDLAKLAGLQLDNEGKALDNEKNRQTMLAYIQQKLNESGISGFNLIEKGGTVEPTIRKAEADAGTAEHNERIAKAKSHPTWLTAQLDGILTDTKGKKLGNRREEIDQYPDTMSRDHQGALAQLSDDIYEKEGYRIPNNLNNIPEIAHLLHEPGALQTDMTQILTDLSNRREAVPRLRSTEKERHRLRVYSGLIDGFERFKALKNAADFSAAAAGFVDGPINDMAKYINLGEQSQIGLAADIRAIRS